MNSNDILNYKNKKNIDFNKLFLNIINNNKKLTKVDLSNTNFSKRDFDILLDVDKREKLLHILLCDCNIILNHEIYDIDSMLKKKNIIISINYTQNQLNRSIKNIENLEFYQQLSHEDRAFQKVHSLLSSNKEKTIYNIEKVIHMWSKPQENKNYDSYHETVYSNDLWVNHQNL